MFENKKYLKFLQKSISQNSDILCVNILEKDDSSFQKSVRTMFLNTNYESVGFDFNIELKNFVFSHFNNILENKKGKYLAYSKTPNSKTIYCWVEPFYSEENYSYMGQALKNAIKGVKTTLLRSTKFSGAHSFVPNFDENKNSFEQSKNLFYEEIKSPIRLLILGTAKGYIQLVRTAELLGWQTCLCDIKGNLVKKIKPLDEIILLNSIQNVTKVFNKNFDVAIIMENETNSNIYLEKLLESSIPNIVVFNSTKESEDIVELFNFENNIIINNRVEFIKNTEYQTIDKLTFKVCKEVENKVNFRKEKKYEFV